MRISKEGVILLILLAGGALLLLTNRAFHQLRKNQKQVIALEKRKKDLAGERQKAEGEIKKLEADPFYVEKVAREQYGLSKPGEIIYKFSSTEKKQNFTDKQR